MFCFAIFPLIHMSSLVYLPLQHLAYICLCNSAVPDAPPSRVNCIFYISPSWTHISCTLALLQLTDKPGRMIRLNNKWQNSHVMTVYRG